MTAFKKLTGNYIKTLLKARPENSHKGNFGHALIIAGCKGKMGAAVIAAKACMRAGAGLLTVNVPFQERLILQIAIPEAMLVIRTHLVVPGIYSSIGVGPALGVNAASKKILQQLLIHSKYPLVIDADAISIIARDKKMLKKIPKDSILTPHPKEFDRLFGQSQGNEERTEKAFKVAKKYNIILVLKGHHTFVTNGKESFINTTGNSGLSKGGSGDALTGIITSLSAQNYDAFAAAKLGVYIHGLSADIALAHQSSESMIITDVINCMGQAFKKLKT